MKKINFNLNDDDIKAISCALEVMISYPFYESESERDAVYMLSVSSGKKLIFHEQLNNRESSFVALAIDNAFKALRNEISATDDIVAALRPYFFTINKLRPVFSPLLEEIDG